MPIQALRSSEPIAGYKIQQRIGAGGYGEVWAAEAPGGLTKAIKFVYGYLDDERAGRELKALNRIKEVRHPFLLSLERIEVVDGQLLIVTELADGCLKDRFDKCQESGNTGIPRDELLVYIRDAADALDYMSEKFSLQHLDVKPENLLLVGGRVKVADFGLVKQLQNVTESLMGGLTPLYAPPEVFDGRPSRHSDQYSLAIVYQEMLTGELPFPGTTAAQLATQHLHGKPRLGVLPSADQQVIARALSKNPDDRFASCRELAEYLCNPERLAAEEASAAAESQLTSASGVATVSQTPTSPQSQPRQRSSGKEGIPLMPQVESAPAVRTAPPIQLDPAETRLRPALFVGIGGIAAQILLNLRRRLRDRFGDATEVPALQMLLLDTDTRALAQTTQGDDGFDPAQTLAMPLRRPQDYRNSTKKITQSLSRRWLYNIPRSLQTEGMRPLGRLALLDHAPTLMDRLQQSIRAAVDPNAISTSEKTTGFDFRAEAPHVVVVSSISGGTGSGMLIDTAFAIRKVLGQLGLSDKDICGLLTHATGRNPTANDLANASAFACVCELAHYGRIDHNYPGDSASGLPAFGSDKAPFENTYLLHLGDELSDDEFETRVSDVAEYLYLDTVTPCGILLDKCRQSDQTIPVGESNGKGLRTFGLFHGGISQDSVLSFAANSLCENLVQTWIGNPFGTDANTKTDPPALIDIDKQAETLAGHLGLKFEALADHLRSVGQQEFGADLDSWLQTVPSTESAGSESNASQVNATIQAIDVKLGVRDENGTPRDASNVQLPDDFVSHIDHRANEIAGEIHQRVLEQLDQSPYHLRAAQRANGWFDALLSSLREQAQETEQHLDAQIAQVFTSLTEAPAAARRNQPAVDPRQQLLHYLKLAIDRLTQHGIRRLVVTLRGRLSETNEKLGDMRRDFGGLANKFDTSGFAEPTDQSSDELDSQIVAQLQARMPELIAELDRRFREEILADQRGLPVVLDKTAKFCAAIPDALRGAARSVIMSAQNSNDVLELLLPTDGDPEKSVRRLSDCVQAATPKLLECGGTKRLLMVVPDGSAYERVQKVIEGGLDETVSVAFDKVGDVVLCYEMQQMPFEQVALKIIDERHDYAEIASRLETRNDINWSPWGA